jgi:hypothetical protein
MKTKYEDYIFFLRGDFREATMASLITIAGVFESAIIYIGSVIVAPLLYG